MTEPTHKPADPQTRTEKRLWEPPRLAVLGNLRDLVQTKGSPQGDGGGNPFKTLEQG